MTLAARMAVTLILALGLAATIPVPAHANRVAITVDDLPIVSEGLSIAAAQANTRRFLAALRKHHVVATGFVNEDKLFVRDQVDARIGILRSWLDAGMDLGNHGFGHLPFQTTPLETYQEAVIKGEVVTRQLLAEHGKKPQYYRYPFDQTGPTIAVRDQFFAFLREHGYQIAPMTMEHDDFVFARVYIEDLQHGNLAEARRVRVAYQAHLDVAMDAFEAMGQSLFGRQIDQVFLIHASQLNADTLDAMLTRLEQRGYQFIPFEAALRDPAYASPDGYAGTYGWSWMRRWAIGLGKTIQPLGQPDPPDWIMQRFDQLTAH
jgi:peptidoglycan/xylan/chitin deacetylase (PgdA/CDA1 family)